MLPTEGYRKLIHSKNTLNREKYVEHLGVRSHLCLVSHLYSSQVTKTPNPPMMSTHSSLSSIFTSIPVEGPSSLSSSAAGHGASRR